MSEFAIGIDVGGTKIATGVMDRDGRILGRHISRCHAGCEPPVVIDAVLESAHAALERAGMAMSKMAGAGVGTAGHVCFERGLVLTNSNLPGWEGFPLRKLLEERLGLPVWLDNDANCATWGEYQFGAGRGARNLCYITFSTGCGAGFVLDNRLYRGSTGTAGEIGHVVVDPDGPLCECGKRGCLMSYACGMALSRMAREHTEAGETILLSQFYTSPDCCISGEQIAIAARQGDRLANELLETAGRYFGIGLSTIVQIINPDRIVIGGGLIRIGAPLLDPCMKALNENIHPVLVDSAQIVFSQLGDDAGVLGAGALVWENHGE